MKNETKENSGCGILFFLILIFIIGILIMNPGITLFLILLVLTGIWLKK